LMRLELRTTCQSRRRAPFGARSIL